jgi:hypothetical protein
VQRKVFTTSGEEMGFLAGSAGSHPVILSSSEGLLLLVYTTHTHFPSMSSFDPNSRDLPPVIVKSSNKLRLEIIKHPCLRSLVWAKEFGYHKGTKCIALPKAAVLILALFLLFFLHCWT